MPICNPYDVTAKNIHLNTQTTGVHSHTILQISGETVNTFYGKKSKFCNKTFKPGGY